jgi:hypothetical protein
MKRLVFIISVLLLAGCSESNTSKEVEPQEKKSLKDRLEDTDRDFLLQPLEAALDDIAAASEYDPRFEKSTMAITLGDAAGKAIIKTFKSDTVYIQVALEGPNGTSEKHQWFSDANNGLYKSEHNFKNVVIGADGAISNQDYQFYFEETGAMISSYSRKSFDQQKHPDKWVSTEFQPSELKFIWSRKAIVKK